MTRKAISMLGLGVLGMALIGCSAGNIAFNQGRKAEERKDWDSALVDFDQALKSQPDNAKFLLHQKLARSQAGILHVEQGKRLLKEDQIGPATGEFEKATAIDPSNLEARQYLTRLLVQEATAKEKQARALKQAIVKSEQQPSGAVVLQPFPTGKIKRIRETADSRQVYETLAKLADVNIGFTSDFQPRPVSLDLENVTVAQALHVVGLETHTFWTAVTPNTILVAPENPANERDYQTMILKTIYLTNPMTPTESNAIVTTLKQLLQMQYVTTNPDANAIIVRDTPERVAEATQVVHDLDRGRAEILIDVTVLEADASRVQDLGMEQVPQSPLSGSNIFGLAYTGSSTVTSLANGTSTQTPIPAVGLDKLHLLNWNDFALVVPGAVANALLTDSHTRILQNPQVRVTDGEKATLKIGSKIPFATGSFLPSYGGITGSTTSSSSSLGLLASTQFQFQEVGVDLELTPHLMPNGDINLKSKIDISSLGQEFTIGGLQEPSFGERSVEHDVTLKEGEVSLLGGLMETTKTHSKSGFPGLADIPILKYAFSSTHTDIEKTEVLIMMTPYVIRLPSPAVEGGMTIATKGGPASGVITPTFGPYQYSPYPGVFHPIPPQQVPPGRP